ncbi:putative odorant receptor 85d [Leguminivora glycinivorella]|uniref:putative odorant receptor 85d n=1 Tax=Leguminivora glycinivorella TaxID=1035111 RepID=UPI0020108A12|nr:putative odorant receptor 85d [Leguminivora glycinivorella]
MSIPTFNDVFQQIRTNLSFMGIQADRPSIGLTFYIFYAMLFTMVSSEIVFFSVNMAPENFLELTGLAPCICVGILSLLKIAALAWKKETVFTLSDELEKLSTENLRDPIKRDIVSSDIILLKTLIKYYFVLNAVLICVYNFSTPFYILYHYLTTKEEIFILPYAVIVPFSTEMWLTWTFVYIFSVLCGFICVLFFTAVDALYFTLTSYVCTIFAVLSNEIITLDQPSDDILSQIIKKHQNVLALAEDLEEIFTLPNFFNVLVGSVEICALGFNLMIGDWNNVPGCMLFIVSVLFQLFMMSVFGEKIIGASIKVGESAFLCDWYKMNKKTQKVLLTLMIRTRKPTRLTAFKYSVICYEGFTKIISNSWSYFTILRTVYSPEDQ